ncbi:uncharacterized protein LOC123547647 [Mercenaria mercenaria]|uniref:uncharacterized protein LOC123547647 n=1 Tax=Mercenaria mercenaria TaxID=6596 RepID=UPI00234E5145|nr:uncharacterized protein LOC123547647 [Mercenaria mercenaria]
MLFSGKLTMEGRIGTIVAVLITFYIQCYFCDDTADDIVSMDVDSDLKMVPFSLTARPFGIQPIQVDAGVAATLTDSKYDHFKKLTGKQHSHLSAVCSKRLSDGGWGYYPFPGSCNQYIHCDKDGNGFLETCAVGTFFNGQKCVKAEDVLCHFDPCRRLPTGRQYSDGQTCFGYYKCLKGQSVSGICPSGFAFNAMKQGCLPDSTCIQPSGIMHPCFAGTTMPFPGQPHLFYLWDGHDSVTAMECPRGLWYNPHVCTCDWVIPGETFDGGMGEGCTSMFHFGYSGNFLEEYNKAPQAPNTAVSIYKKSALFSKGGRIVIWMMNDIDMDSEWALCFEFMTQSYGGEVALVSNDWKKVSFTYKITHIPGKNLVVGYFRMKDGTIAELIVMGVKPNIPHFLRVAKLGAIMKMRIDNMPAATVAIGAGVASATTPMVIGAARGCHGFKGFFDELKFFRCVPATFFKDYKGLM